MLLRVEYNGNTCCRGCKYGTKILSENVLQDYQYMLMTKSTHKFKYNGYNFRIKQHK